MPPYPNSSAIIDTHYASAREQLEHLVGTLRHPDVQGVDPWGSGGGGAS